MNFSKTTENWEQKLSASFAKKETVPPKKIGTGKSKLPSRKGSPDVNVKNAVKVLD